MASMEFRFIALLLVISCCGIIWKSGPLVLAWLRAKRLEAPIPIWRIGRMYFQNLSLEAVVEAYATAIGAQVEITLDEIVAHARSGGDIRAAVSAYIELLRAGVPMDFLRVCAIDSESSAIEERPIY